MPKIHSPAAVVIGQRIRDARRALGLSMEDLSELSEVSGTTVGKVERGAQSPTSETLVRLTAVLNIEPGEVLRGITPADYGVPTHKYTARDFIRERRRKDGTED